MAVLRVDAADTQNPLADKILDQLDIERAKTPEIAQQLLTQLSRLIDKKDQRRLQRFDQVKCWNQLRKTKAQKEQAILIASQLKSKYQQRKLNALLLDLSLCEASFLSVSTSLDHVSKVLTELIDQAYSLEEALLVAKGRSLRGSVSSFQGDYSAALDDLVSAQQIFIKFKQRYWKNANLGELAATYRRSGDAQSALDYQRKLEQNYQQQGRIFEANDVSIQIASSYEQLQLFDKAIERYHQSEQFLNENEQLIYAADISVTIAGILIKQGHYQKARMRLESAQTVILPRFSAPYSYLSLYLARAYFHLGQYQQSLIALNNAQQAFSNDENKRGLGDVTLLKSRVYKEMSEWREAYQFLSTYYDAHLKSDEAINLKRNEQMKARFHNQKIQIENALLLQSTKEQEKKLLILAEQDRMRTIIIILVAIILLVVSLIALIQINSKRRFQQLAHTDELTQLSNRRDIYAKGEALLSDALHQQQSIAMISFDADYFKQVNDRYGHEIGDKVLKTIAQIGRSSIRDIDQLGRIGGEEFLIVLPNCSLSQAEKVAQHLLESMEKFEWQVIANDLKQTVSAGVVAVEKIVIEKDTVSEFSALLVKADKALYRAKAKGRNCFEIYE
jgi:diguanylate cyclase (GGDEF)-like protein